MTRMTRTPRTTRPPRKPASLKAVVTATASTVDTRSAQGERADVDVLDHAPSTTVAPRGALERHGNAQAVALAARANGGARMQNPIVARNRPDPSLTFRDRDGFVYAYSTRNYGNNIVNVPVERTRDFASFEEAGDAMPTLPSWALPGTRDIWAPQVVPGDGAFGERGKYYMFFCCPYDANGALAQGKKLAEGFGIGVAVADGPAGPFVDSGAPLAHGPGFSVLDPMIFRDPATGQAWFLSGSHHQPIVMRKLDASLLAFAEGSEAIAIRQPRDVKYERLLEGAFLVHRPESKFPYQLYTSGDNVWEQDEYAVTVYVAEKLEGPYRGVCEVDKQRKDNVVLRGDARMERTGHNSVFRDDAGSDFIVYHAVDRRAPKDPSSGELMRVMMMDPIHYDDLGLPFMKGGVPGHRPQAAPVLR